MNRSPSLVPYRAARRSTPVALAVTIVMAQAQTVEPTPAAPQAAASAPKAQAPVASQTLETVVVTAEKRTQDLQKTSISVATVPGSRVNEQGLTQADTVLKDVPGVVVQGASRGQMVSIRGLGFDLPSGLGESPVALNFDGVYNFRVEGGSIGFFDLARVEVLRGPQSTLYGRNATAGVVNVLTSDPDTDRVSGYATAEVGSYSNRRVEGALNLPLGGKWAARVAYTNVDREGYYTNGANDNVANGFRGKLKYQDDGLSLLLGAERLRQKGKGVTYVTPANWAAGNYFVSEQSPLTSQDYTGDKVWAQLDWTLGPGTLTVLPSFQRAAATVIEDDAPFGLQTNLDPKRATQRTVDIRYASLASSPVQWLAGVYTYVMNNDTDTFRAHNAFDKTDSKAAYGQVTVPFGDGWRGIVGARAAEDKKSFQATNGFSGVTASDARTSHAADFRLGVEKQLDPSSLLYTTLSTGHRPGGFNSFGDGSAFDAEKLTSLEIGSKNRFMQGAVQLNGSLFYYDYRNYQLSDFYQAAPGVFVLTISNVPKVTNMGGEIETKANVGKGFTVNGALSYLSSRYRSSFFLHDDPFNAFDMNGKSLPHAPKWTLRGGVQHQMDLGDKGALTTRLDIRHLSDQYLAPFNGETQLQKAYTQADASVTWESDNGDWSVNGYVRNLTNKIIATAYLVGYVTGAPRTFGLVATRRF